MKRILTALVALPILLYTVWNDIPYFFVALTAVAVLLGLFEFYRMAAKAVIKPHIGLAYPAGLAIIGCFTWHRLEWIVAVLTLLTLASLTTEVFRASDLSTSLASVAATVLGVCYVALLAGFLVGVRMTPDELTSPATPKLAAKLLTMFFAMVMMTDTGAYYTGRALGRHKLAPRISPGKTIEGSIGGFLTAALAGWVFKLVLFPEISTAHVLVLGAVIGIVGQVGDLAESLCKRGAGVKDSGNIFPGHGGMLDRLDSLVFCAPLIYYYSRWFFAA